MKELNNWNEDKIIHKGDILEWEFLIDNEYVTEIIDGFYYLNRPFYEVEMEFYKRKNALLRQTLGIKNVKSELKLLIKKFNEYNRIKDVAEELCGKIANLKEVPIRDVHKEFGIEPDKK